MDTQEGYRLPCRMSVRTGSPRVRASSLGSLRGASRSPSTPTYGALPPLSCPPDLEARNNGLLVGGPLYFRGTYWVTKTQGGVEVVVGGPHAHAACMTKVGWNSQTRESFMNARWVGGEDDGKPIAASLCGNGGAPSFNLPLSFLHDNSARHGLSLPDFNGGLLGYHLSAEFIENDFSHYTAYAYMKGQPKELKGEGDFREPSALLEFCPIAIQHANRYATSADPHSPDDGLLPLTASGCYDTLSHHLHLHQIVQSDGCLDNNMVDSWGLRKPLINPNVEPFILTEDDTRGREGLKIGELGLRSKAFIHRGEFLCLYTGMVKRPEECSGAADGSWGNRLMATDLLPGSTLRKIIIDPKASPFTAADGNVGQFANDPSIDLANKCGKRMRGTCEQNAIIIPFRFFHFPMMAVFAERDIPLEMEIMMDYGEDYTLP